MTTVEDFIAQFRDTKAKIEAMPDQGAVLFFHEAKLAMNLDGDKPYACGLMFATVRGRGLEWPHITNGNGEVAKVTAMADAKRMAIECVELAIAGLEGRKG